MNIASRSFASRRRRIGFVPVAALASLTVVGSFLAGCGAGSGTTAIPRTNPTPTPSPVATPPSNPGSATLAAYFGSVSSTNRLTYRDTTTTTYDDPITGQPTSNTDTTTYTTDGRDPFASGETGAKTTVLLATAQGNVNVTRQEVKDNGVVTGYTYYTLNANAYTLYGADTLDDQARTTQKTRYAPAARFTLNLSQGQTSTQNTTVTQTTIETDDNTTTTQTFSQNLTLKFVGLEPVTVPAGTYASAAHVTLGLAYNSATQESTPGVSVNTTIDTWFAKSVGTVKSSLDGTFASTFANPATGQNQTMTTRIVSATELISIAGN